MAAAPVKKDNVLGYIKLQIMAGKATPAPPIGPALGQKGVNIMEFCKQFNERTKDLGEMPVPVVITVFKDKSFTFITKIAPSSFLVKKAAKLTKGSTEPGRKSIGTITKDALLEIAKMKMQDMNCFDVDAAFRMLKGTATSIGLEVTE